MAEHYPAGTVRRLLDTNRVTAPTRAALRERMDKPPRTAPQALDEHAFATLRAACDRLIPQHHRELPINLAGALDERLADDTGDGWRYAALPPDADAYRQGLQGLDERAQSLFGSVFVALDGAQQDAVLQALQDGRATDGVWAALPAERFFEELLADLVQLYYSDPISQEEIGYVGMADAQGWSVLGLNAAEAWEPQPDEDAHA